MELLKTLTLHLELFAGTDISDAARDLCQLAGRVGVLCEVDFNGVKLWARPGDNPQHLVQAYHEQLQRAPAHYKIAQARDARPAAAVQEMQTDARKMCTCDGAGRGAGRVCVVKAGGRLGDLWRCANGLLTGCGNG